MEEIDVLLKGYLFVSMVLNAICQGSTSKVSHGGDFTVISIIIMNMVQSPNMFSIFTIHYVHQLNLKPHRFLCKTLAFLVKLKKRLQVVD